uniref:Nucleotide-diphospho-sugar transferase domain-containing protein n=1 Tax=Caenorhabditis tropicalis TaxID=1561998 RepID=A0A1I7U6W4_9PELO
MDRRKPIILLLSIFFTAFYLLNCESFLVLFRPDFDIKMSPEHRAYVYEKMIEAFRKRDKSCEDQGLYCRRPETQHIDCGRVLIGDKEYQETLVGVNRIPLIPDPFLNMSCAAISYRIHRKYLHYEPLKLRGTAFARIVYKDYEFIEKQVQVSYHPQNAFCFVVDQKAPAEFHEKMKRLGECVENVQVLPATESYSSDGHNVNLGHLRCMESLVQRPNWSYLLLLQNHDVISKSVYELDRIFDLMGGANDVAMSMESKGRRKMNLKWDPRSLRLFKNESGYPEEILNSEMTISSGYVQGSLSRAAVEWITSELDLTIFLDQWSQTKYGCDEQLLSSLQVNQAFGMPGHFTDECIKQKMPVPMVTRMTLWAFGNPDSCATRTVRNELCIFGIEDFRALAGMPNLMFNKMIPSFDYSIVECAAELLYNRTFLGQVDTVLNEEYYDNLPAVQYHKYHQEPGFLLNCTTDYGLWVYSDFL